MSNEEFLDSLESLPGEVFYLSLPDASRLVRLANRIWFLRDFVPGTNLVQLGHSVRADLIDQARANLVISIARKLLL